jgi:hypothetical protein
MNKRMIHQNLEAEVDVLVRLNTALTRFNTSGADPDISTRTPPIAPCLLKTHSQILLLNSHANEPFS